jgi:hypothetical protein
VEQREDGGVCADADREREDRGRTEDRIPRERAQAVAQIGEERLQPDEHVAIAGTLALERVAPESALRFALRGVGRNARFG